MYLTRDFQDVWNETEKSKNVFLQYTMYNVNV